MPPGDHSYFAAFGFHLRNQRGLFLDRPFPPSLDPRDEFHIGHTNLLLELRKESPATQSMGDGGPPRYTSDARRSRNGCLSCAVKKTLGGLPRRRGRMTRLEDRQILVREIEQVCVEGARIARPVPWPASTPARCGAGRPVTVCGRAIVGRTLRALLLAAVKTRAHPAAGSFWWDNGH
jgi:hypothetical protein